MGLVHRNLCVARKRKGAKDIGRVRWGTDSQESDKPSNSEVTY